MVERLDISGSNAMLILIEPRSPLGLLFLRGMRTPTAAPAKTLLQRPCCEAVRHSAGDRVETAGPIVCVRKDVAGDTDNTSRHQHRANVLSISSERGHPSRLKLLSRSFWKGKKNLLNTLYLCLCSIAVTVTALPPTRLCRLAVFLVKPTFSQIVKKTRTLVFLDISSFQGIEEETSSSFWRAN